METANLRAWLASPDQPFALGAALYATLGASPTYRRLFALGETAYSRQVLLRELRELRELAGGVGGVGEVAAVAAVPAPAAPSLPPAAADSPALADVRRQLKAVRDERSHLHPQLTAPRAGTKARFATALRILELTEQEARLKETEAHVLDHGRLPGPVATADVQDAGELRRRLANLSSRRAKLRRRPDRAAELAAAEEEIQLIRLKINAHAT